MRKGGPGQLFTPFGFTVLVLLAAIGVALWLAWLPWRWERTKDELRHRFPGVRHVEAKDLTDWIANTGEPQPVVIDVRAQADYDFSHLPHALRMAVSDTPASLGILEKTDRTVVVYDAVGEDAFPVAESLIKRGYERERVRVLEGGIFEWANRGLPLEGASGATGTVRAGKSKFAGLLKGRATAQ
jgi:rhodanese-related sulfurtransferase